MTVLSRRFFLLGALLWALAPLCLRAQEYNFRNFSVAEGLAQSQVYALCEDRRGYLWCGTRGGGLSRFDGMAFTAFTEEDGLLDNYVRCIFEDRSGRLWIGTDEGVSVYDGRTFANFSKQNGLDDYLVNAIAEDSSGIVRIGTDQGTVLRYEGGKFVHELARKDLPGRRVSALFTDKKGRVWIGTDDGLALYSGGRTRVYRVRDGLPSGIIRDIVQDTSGALWIATYGGGVCRFDGEQLVRFGTAEGMSNQTVLCAFADASGAVWFGTAGGGVNRIEAGQVSVFTEREGLCNNVITAIRQASDGTLWFGSSGGGMSGYDGSRFVHFTERSGTVGNWVYALLQDHNGDMWLGTSLGGVTRYDGMLYTRYTASNGFTAAKVRCIFRDRSNMLWFGTVGDGVFVYDGKSFRRIGIQQGMKARFINAIDQDAHGDMWFACADVGAVWYRAGATVPCVTIGLREGLRSVRVFDIHCGSGRVWAATDGAGVGVISLQGDSLASVQMLTTSDGMSSNTVRSIAAAGDALVFGTGGGGLSVYREGAFTAIRRRDGISSDNIYFVHAADSVLWIGTERGIDRITYNSAFGVEHVRHYGRAEGIPGVETAQNAVCTDNLGRLWFGTIRGAVRYDPRGDRPNTAPPNTHISEIRLFFKPITATPFADSILPWYPVPVQLVLPYDQNHLSFDVVGISLRNPEAVRYRWKLEGFDRDWTPPTAQRTAVYSNIPPGHYTFRVLAINEDGVPDPTPVEFSFEVTPPFWSTWWFTGLVGVCIAAGLAGAYNARISAVRRRSERERSEIEMRRAIAELEQKSLRLSMNPHFIFNALTSIQAFAGEGGNSSARRYLAKFAKLMRAILENSRSAAVPLEEEIAVLENYLALEQLAANAGFDYEILCEPSVDPGAMLVPPMLLQPLVENAVHHGVAHLQARGRIEVRFAFANNLLCCTVTDNGVGRAKSAELQKHNGQASVGAALAVTRERLAIMSKQHGVDARLLITDLADERGAAVGTKAEIFVPVVREE